jgi:hypothetical protein
MALFKYEPVDQEFDRILLPQEVTALGETVVWPAVDILYGGKFIKDAKFRSCVEFGVTFEGDNPLDICRPQINAYVDVRSQGEDELLVAYHAIFELHTRRADLDEHVCGLFHNLHTQQNSDEDSDDEYEVDSIMDADELEAWEVVRYSFFEGNYRHPYPFLVERFLELYDEDDDRVWDNQVYLGTDGRPYTRHTPNDITLSDYEHEIARELDESYNSLCTVRDKLTILSIT